MKKMFVAVMLAGAATAHAAEVGLAVGADDKLGRDVTVASLGTKFAGLNVGVELSRAEDTYTGIAATAGRSFQVFGLRVLPHGSLGYIRAEDNALKNGAVGSTGIEIAYPLNKSVFVGADLSYRFDLTKDTNYEGAVLTLGFKTTF
jgi:hypothetical protein